MAPIVSQNIAPKISVKRGITRDDPERKRKKLHSIVRRMVEGPDAEDSKPIESNPQTIAISSNTVSEPTRSVSPALSSTSSIPSESSSLTTSDCDRLVRKKVDRVPRRMSQLLVLPGMELVVPVKYNQKMARSFPDLGGRSERDQDRRIRNTISARESRAKLRLMNELLQKQAIDARRINVTLKIGLSSGFSYARELLHRLNLPMMDFFDMWQKAKDSLNAEPVEDNLLECKLEEENDVKVKMEIEEPNPEE